MTAPSSPTRNRSWWRSAAAVGTPWATSSGTSTALGQDQGLRRDRESLDRPHRVAGGCEQRPVRRRIELRCLGRPSDAETRDRGVAPRLGRIADEQPGRPSLGDVAGDLDVVGGEVRAERDVRLGGIGQVPEGHRPSHDRDRVAGGQPLLVVAAAAPGRGAAQQRMDLVLAGRMDR